MRIESHCRERALLLLQIADKSVEFKEQAAFLAQSWLVVATLEDQLGSGAAPTEGGRPARD